MRQVKSSIVQTLQIIANLLFVVVFANYYARAAHAATTARNASDQSLFVMAAIIIYIIVVLLYLRTGSEAFLITVLCSVFFLVQAYELYQDQIGDNKYFSVGFSREWQMFSGRFLVKAKDLYYWLIAFLLMNFVLLLFMGKLKSKYKSRGRL